jgi:hypothetical protein
MRKYVSSLPFSASFLFPFQKLTTSLKELTETKALLDNAIHLHELAEKEEGLKVSVEFIHKFLVGFKNSPKAYTPFAREIAVTNQPIELAPGCTKCYKEFTTFVRKVSSLYIVYVLFSLF